MGTAHLHLHERVGGLMRRAPDRSGPNACDTPLVSVVIPTFNRAQMLREALQSVRWQTVKNVEIIVVDDARTTDETPAVAKAFGADVVYLREPQPGVSAARNRGIRHARAPLIAFLDADDVWLPHKLERQLDFLHEHPNVGLLYAQLWSYDIDNPRARRLDPSRPARTFRELLNGPNAVTTSTVVVRRECFDVVGVFNPALPASEDHELWLRIARRFAIGFLEEPLAEYRRKTNGINSNHQLLFEGYRGFYEILLRDYRPHLARPRAAERQLAKFEYLCGTNALKRGERRRALKLIRRALARDAALGQQFVNKNAPWHVKVWMPIKPYAALTVSAVQAMGKN